MPFLTIFTSPKPFSINPHISIIQRNAIQSWIHLDPEVEVYLMGDEEGMVEIADEFQLKHFPEVRCSERGTPYVSSMFDLAKQTSQAPFLAILNADIMLMPDFIEASRRVAEFSREFLILGRRWDLDIDQELDFSSEWVQQLLAEVKTRGVLHGPVGSDYFLFPRDLFGNMPDFTIGRSGWDNWTIYHACHSGWDVIDVTRAATIVHQNHDYSHLPGGKPHYDLPETKNNITIAGGMKKMYTILETNKILVDGMLKPVPLSIPRLLHQIELFITNDDLHGIRRTLVRWLRKTRRKYEK